MSRKISDGLLNFITYIASGISVVVLGAILVYLVSQGAHLLNWNLLKDDYFAKSLKGAVVENYIYQESNTFYEGEGYYSKKWGIGFVDSITSQKEKVIEVTYIDKNSPFNYLYSTIAGENEASLKVEVSNVITVLYYFDESGKKIFLPETRIKSAENLVYILENDVYGIESIGFQTLGGGIFGSIIVTLLLILISIVIALPIGIGAAIYLNEYASKSNFNHLLRQGIETLTGVPSIIYGLMGITVLFPITQLFGATSTSVLLGGFTVAVILLPTIIRSTEEALIVVPQSLRDGSLSLGATKSQTIFKVVLPCAVNGILTGVLLSIGRVIGESAALIYTTSTVINDSPKVLEQGTSLALMIWTIMSGEQPNFELASAISLIILIIVFMLNIVVKIIGKRLSKSFV
jgi:phosphate transport system permease protein